MRTPDPQSTSTVTSVVPWAAPLSAVDWMIVATDSLRRATSTGLTMLFDPSARRRRKLIAMAQDCAYCLRLGDWDVVMWDPESITLRMLDILAASPEMRTPEARTEAAWQLSGARIDESPVDKFVNELMADDIPEECRGVAFKYVIDADPWSISVRILKEVFSIPYAHLEVLGIRNIFLLLLSIMADIEPEIFGEGITAGFFDDLPRYPFHSLRDMNFAWSETQLRDYEQEWDAAFELVRKTLAVDRTGNIAPSSTGFDYLRACSKEWVAAFELVRKTFPVDRTGNIAPSSTGFGYLQAGSKEWAALFLDFAAVSGMLGWKGPDQDLYDDLADKSSGIGRAFIKAFLVRAYVSFVSHRLGLQTMVGKCTNLKYLREKHYFNNRIPSDDESAWKAFKSSVFFSNMPNLSFEEQRGRSYDYFQMIVAVLGGESRQVTNIQRSIVDVAYNVSSVNKDTFLRCLNRRKVCLLRCGEDRALVLPYLNKIILHLRDGNWVRAHDVEALQPFKGDYNSGAVRRAANVLLAMEYPKAGHPVVNEAAVQLINEYAEKGELYSHLLRKHLLSVMFLRDRVSIDKLAISAHQIFQEDELMVSALVRELIHDRLHTNSDISPSRVLMKTQQYENDAYFDMFYLRRRFPVRNNVRWGSGVPLHGLSLKETGRRGLLEGLSVREVTLDSANGGFEVTVWVPESSDIPVHLDMPSCYVEDPKYRIQPAHDAPVVFLKSQDLRGQSSGSNSTHKLGQYCVLIEGNEASQVEKSTPLWTSSNEFNSIPWHRTTYHDVPKDMLELKSVVTEHVLEQSMARSYAASVLFGEEQFFRICEGLTRVICPHDPRDMELFREELFRESRNRKRDSEQVDYMTAADQTIVFALSFIFGKSHPCDLSDEEWNMLRSFMSCLSKVGVERVRFWMKVSRCEPAFIPFTIWPTVRLYSGCRFKGCSIQEPTALWGAGLFESNAIGELEWKWSSRVELQPDMALKMALLNVFHGTDNSNKIEFGDGALRMAQLNIFYAKSGVDVSSGWKDRLSVSKCVGRNVVSNLLLRDGEKNGQYLDWTRTVKRNGKWNGVVEFLSGNQLDDPNPDNEFKEAFKKFDWYNFATMDRKEYQLLRLYDASPSNARKSLWLLVKMHGRSLNFKYGRMDWTRIVRGRTSPLLRGAIENNNLTIINEMLKDQLGDKLDHRAELVFESWKKVGEEAKPEWTAFADNRFPWSTRI